MVYKTTDYEKFKLIIGNRKLLPGHISKLVKSIGENNYLHSNPIIVNENMEVIDGQHRLEACKQLNIPVHYAIIEKGSLDSVILFNENQKAWKVQDYLDSYVYQGNLNYTTLSEFVQVYNLPIGTGIHLLDNRSLSHGKIMQEFKKGNFKVKNLKYAEDFAKKLSELRTVFDKNIVSSRDFMSAFEMANKNPKFDYSIFLQKAKIDGVVLHRRGSAKDYLREIEEIYNHWSRVEEKRVRLF
jgi:hypothetical protein